MKDLFISYTNSDKKKVEQITKYLELFGIKCWVAPRDVKAGKDYASQIVQAIQKIPVFMVIISEASIQSRHVFGEVALAFDSNQLIIPFFVDNAKLPFNLQYYIGTSQWITAYENFEAGMKELLDTMKKNDVISTEKITLKQDSSSKNGM